MDGTGASSDVQEDQVVDPSTASTAHDGGGGTPSGRRRSNLLGDDWGGSGSLDVADVSASGDIGGGFDFDFDQPLRVLRTHEELTTDAAFDADFSLANEGESGGSGGPPQARLSHFAVTHEGDVGGHPERVPLNPGHSSESFIVTSMDPGSTAEQPESRPRGDIGGHGDDDDSTPSEGQSRDQEHPTIRVHRPDPEPIDDFDGGEDWTGGGSGGSGGIGGSSNSLTNEVHSGDVGSIGGFAPARPSSPSVSHEATTSTPRMGPGGTSEHFETPLWGDVGGAHGNSHMPESSPESTPANLVQQVAAGHGGSGDSGGAQDAVDSLIGNILSRRPTTPEVRLQGQGGSGESSSFWALEDPEPVSSPLPMTRQAEASSGAEPFFAQNEDNDQRVNGQGGLDATGGHPQQDQPPFLFQPNPRGHVSDEATGGQPFQDDEFGDFSTVASFFEGNPDADATGGQPTDNQESQITSPSTEGQTNADATGGQPIQGSSDHETRQQSSDDDFSEFTAPVAGGSSGQAVEQRSQSADEFGDFAEATSLTGEGSPGPNIKKHPADGGSSGQEVRPQQLSDDEFEDFSQTNEAFGAGSSVFDIKPSDDEFGDFAESNAPFSPIEEGSSSPAIRPNQIVEDVAPVAAGLSVQDIRPFNDEFGDFSEPHASVGEGSSGPAVSPNQLVDDEFGDFFQNDAPVGTGSSVCDIKPSDDNSGDFAEFSTPLAEGSIRDVIRPQQTFDDEFADFSETKVIQEGSSAYDSRQEQPFDDDFGDFSEPKAFVEGGSGARDIQSQQHSEEEFGDFSDPKATVGGGQSNPDVNIQQPSEDESGHFSETKAPTGEGFSVQAIGPQQPSDDEFGDFSESTAPVAGSNATAPVAEGRKQSDDEFGDFSDFAAPVAEGCKDGAPSGSDDDADGTVDAFSCGLGSTINQRGLSDAEEDFDSFGGFSCGLLQDDAGKAHPVVLQEGSSERMQVNAKTESRPPESSGDEDTPSDEEQDILHEKNDFHIKADEDEFADFETASPKGKEEPNQKPSRTTEKSVAEDVGQTTALPDEQEASSAPVVPNDDDDDDFADFACAAPSSSDAAGNTKVTTADDDEEEWGFAAGSTTPAITAPSMEDLEASVKLLTSRWCDVARKCEPSIERMLQLLEADVPEPSTSLTLSESQDDVEASLARAIVVPAEARCIIAGTADITATVPFESLGLTASAAKELETRRFGARVREDFFNVLGMHLQLPPQKPEASTLPTSDAIPGVGTSTVASPEVDVSTNNTAEPGGMIFDAADWGMFEAPSTGNQDAVESTSVSFETGDLLGGFGSTMTVSAPMTASSTEVAAEKVSSKKKGLPHKVKKFLTGLPDLRHLYSTTVIAS